MKKDYWKVVCPEFPGGMICLSLRDAKDFAENERESAGRGEVYIRKVRMSEEDFNRIDEAA